MPDFKNLMLTYMGQKLFLKSLFRKTFPPDNIYIFILNYNFISKLTLMTTDINLLLKLSYNDLC